MKLSALPLLAASSLLLGGLAHASMRPQYGGTLRVAMRGAPASLDPADLSQPDSVSRRNLCRLLFDTLVTLDDFGRIQPALARSWQADPGNQRWQLALRAGVVFDDGSPLTPSAVAAALRATNAGWTVYALGDSIAIELKAPDPALAAELALPRNSIIKRLPDRLSGTGPFRVSEWQPGKKLVVTANEDYWGGRPFLNSIEIDFGISWGDEMLALELGKADVVDIAPEQAHRTAAEGHRVSGSAPSELVALVFARDAQSPEEGKLRHALALCIDRASIKNVLLQGEGDPAGGILPDWMTGYEFLFPSQNNMPAAQQERAEVPYAPAWTLGYDAADPLGRVIAERIALNARDAGITLRPTTGGGADLRLVRSPLASINPTVALAAASVTFGLPAPRLGSDSAADLYQAESAILQSQRIIPLFHLPANYGLSLAVKNWKVKRAGSWDLSDVWLATEKP